MGCSQGEGEAALVTPPDSLPPLPYGPSPITPPNKQYGRQRTPRLQGLKEAILDAAEDVGMDGKGMDGLVGYLRLVATRDAKAFCGLLGKVLPMQITGKDGDALEVVFRTVYETKAPTVAST